MPCGNEYFQPAYWVKQMAEGQVVGLPWEYTLGQTLFVTKIYASPATNDEENLGPVSMLKPWLLDLLSGPAIHFGALLKHIKSKDNWGWLGKYYTTGSSNIIPLTFASKSTTWRPNSTGSNRPSWQAKNDWSWHASNDQPMTCMCSA
jgi:hypothetical protein